MRKIALSFLALVALTGSAFAQATSVQQAGTRLDVATAVAFAQAAVGSQSTATITVPAGLYAYITGISIDFCNNGTGTAQANANFTSTNINSTPSWAVSIAASANICIPPIREQYATPLKSSAPGTNVTVVSPGGTITNNQATIRVYYYLAP